MVSGNLVFIGGGFCEEDFFYRRGRRGRREREKRV